MAYIIFLHPNILASGFKDVADYDLDVTAAAATTSCGSSRSPSSYFLNAYIQGFLPK